MTKDRSELMQNPPLLFIIIIYLLAPILLPGHARGVFGWQKLNLK